MHESIWDWIPVIHARTTCLSQVTKVIEIGCMRMNFWNFHLHNMLYLLVLKIYEYVHCELCRLGVLVDFLSHSTITGFMGGTAIIICLQQLKGILGLESFTTKTDVVAVLTSVFEHKKEVRIFSRNDNYFNQYFFFKYNNRKHAWWSRCIHKY